MSSCGGTITTQTIIVGDDPVQVVGKDENRTRVTLYADGTNTVNIFLTATQGARFREGFPLVPGATYQFDDRGARAMLFALTANKDGQRLYVVTEGA